MPTKVQPKWGWRAVVRSEKSPLRDGSERELRRLLGDPADEKWLGVRSELEWIARMYRMTKHRDTGPSAAQQEAALRSLQKQAYALGTAFHSLDDASMRSLTDAARATRFPIEAIDLAKAMLTVHSVIEWAMRDVRSKKRRARPRGKALPIAVTDLRQLYRRTTGRPASWSLVGKGADRAPKPAAGRFLAAFFKAVDPTVNVNAIDHAIRRGRLNGSSQPV